MKRLRRLRNIYSEIKTVRYLLKKYKSSCCRDKCWEQYFLFKGNKYRIEYKHWGNCYDKRWYATEIINDKTGKVIARRWRYTENLDKHSCYRENINQLFTKNLYNF